jgi:hypothetical protein
MLPGQSIVSSVIEAQAPGRRHGLRCSRVRYRSQPTQPKTAGSGEPEADDVSASARRPAVVELSSG